jgi:hypothetical protein
MAKEPDDAKRSSNDLKAFRFGQSEESEPLKSPRSILKQRTEAAKNSYSDLSQYRLSSSEEKQSPTNRKNSEAGSPIKKFFKDETSSDSSKRLSFTAQTPKYVEL